MRGRKILAKFAKSEAFVGSAHSAETIKKIGRASCRERVCLGV